MDLEWWDDTVFDYVDSQPAATPMEATIASGKYI